MQIKINIDNCIRGVSGKSLLEVLFIDVGTELREPQGETDTQGQAPAESSLQPQA